MNFDEITNEYLNIILYILRFNCFHCLSTLIQNAHPKNIMIIAKILMNPTVEYTDECICYTNDVKNEDNIVIMTPPRSSKKRK